MTCAVGESSVQTKDSWLGVGHRLQVGPGPPLDRPGPLGQGLAGGARRFFTQVGVNPCSHQSHWPRVCGQRQAVPVTVPVA